MTGVQTCALPIYKGPAGTQTVRATTINYYEDNKRATATDIRADDAQIRTEQFKGGTAGSATVKIGRASCRERVYLMV